MRDPLGSVQSLLVLGGGSDIGLATAEALVRRRARTVILAARSPDRLRPGAARLEAAGATTVDCVEFDADDTESHPRAIDRAFDRHGDIDLALVAFGVLGGEASAAADPSAVLPVLRTNFVGATSAMLAVVRRLRAQGHGTVVVLSSVAAERPRKSNFVYGASKSGLDAFSQGLGDSLAGTGVRIMVVRPGFVATKMTEGLKPAPFSTTPDGVARAILDGLRRDAHTVWAPPALRLVMSVLRHLPRPIFRRLPI